MIGKFRGEHAWLSNFAPAQVHTLDDDDNEIPLPTVEHAYQVFKIGNWTQFQEATGLSPEQYGRMTPGQAKRLGRKLPLRSDWEKVKQDVMLHLLREKFQQPELAELLLATGDQELREGNEWHDQYWGDCTCPRHADVLGRNVLGRMLMYVRDTLRYEVLCSWRYPKAASEYAQLKGGFVILDQRSMCGGVPRYMAVRERA